MVGRSMEENQSRTSGKGGKLVWRRQKLNRLPVPVLLVK